MGIMYDNTVNVAQAGIQLVICRETLKAMRAVVTDPDKSCVIERHNEALIVAGMEMECAVHHADAAEEAESVRQWNEGQLEFNQSNTWVKALLQLHDSRGVSLSEQCIQRYLSDSHTAEYGYIDTVNPEGISQAVLNEQEYQSFHFMMASLSLLNEQDIEQVLTNNQARDHDNSLFKVTSLGDVLEWRVQCGSKTIAEVMRGYADDKSEREIDHSASPHG